MVSLAVPALLHCPMGLVSCQQAESSGSQLGIAWQPRVWLLPAPWQWQRTAGRAQGRAPSATGFWQGARAGNTFLCSYHIHQSPRKSAPQIPSLHCPAVPLCVLLLKLQVPVLSAATPPAQIVFPLSESLQHSIQSSLVVRQEKVARGTNSSPASRSLLFFLQLNQRLLERIISPTKIQTVSLHFSASPTYSIVCYQAAFWRECRFLFWLHGFAWPWESSLHNSRARLLSFLSHAF